MVGSAGCWKFGSFTRYRGMNDCRINVAVYGLLTGQIAVSVSIIAHPAPTGGLDKIVRK